MQCVGKTLPCNAANLHNGAQKVKSGRFCTKSGTSDGGTHRKRVVLLHEPPTSTFSSDRTKLGNFSSSSSSSSSNSAYDFILSLGCPVVMVVSSAAGREDHAERFLPPHIRHRFGNKSWLLLPMLVVALTAMSLTAQSAAGHCVRPANDGPESDQGARDHTE